MEDIFIKGNRITTNKRNCFEVINTNEYQVVCKDLVTDDFYVLKKSEHTFELADLKVILGNSLSEVLDETNITKIEKSHVLSNMKLLLDKWL